MTEPRILTREEVEQAFNDVLDGSAWAAGNMLACDATLRARVEALETERDELRWSLVSCIGRLKLDNKLTHKTVCVNYDPAGSTYESTPQDWWVEAQQRAGTALPPADAPRLPHVDAPAGHVEAAERFNRCFVEVPLTDVERIPIVNEDGMDAPRAETPVEHTCIKADGEPPGPPCHACTRETVAIKTDCPCPRLSEAEVRAKFRRMLQIGRELPTQDNACTAHPIFVVEQRKRQYGIDTDYTECVVWLSEDGDSTEADADMFATLEAAHQDGQRDPDEWRRVGYTDTWEHVQSFLTRAAADDYISRRGYNLTDPRVFVDSGYRNQEWIDLRAELAALAALFPTPTEGQKP